MNIFLKALSPVLLLAPLSALATPYYLIDPSPASTENMWKTSSVVGSPIIASYVPALSEFDNVTPVGYADGNATVNEFEQFAGSSTGDGYRRFLYSTYIMSDVNQTIEIVINGDDGHSLYADGVSIGGGGFGVGVVATLDLDANKAVKLDAVHANSGGPWNYSIGVDQKIIKDTRGTEFIFPTYAITSVPGIRMDAEGFAEPLACIGFDAPMSNGAVKVKKNRVLPLKAELFDEDGNPVDDLGITSAPVLTVMYDSGSADAEDVSAEALAAGEGTDGNQFEFNLDTNQWQFNLKTKNYTAAGTYSVSLISGDATYSVEPACEASFVIQ